MSRKKKTRAPKAGPVWRKTAVEATLDQMPKYNAHACGTGAHGDVKYNRAKQKQAWHREMYREEARSRGSLLLSGRLNDTKPMGILYHKPGRHLGDAGLFRVCLPF